MINRFSNTLRVALPSGVLSTLYGNSADWRFTSRDLWHARQIHALERDFDAVPALAAPMADLMQALDTPYACLRRAGLR
jgi:chaperone modulatory protein CbpM